MKSARERALERWFRRRPAKRVGFSEEELTNPYDLLMLCVLRDAAAYRRLKAAKVET